MAQGKDRWLLTIIYRGEVGPVDFDCEIAEIGDAVGIISNGPDSSSILWISIEPSSANQNATTLQSPLQPNR